MQLESRSFEDPLIKMKRRHMLPVLRAIKQHYKKKKKWKKIEILNSQDQLNDESSVQSYPRTI